MEERLMRLGEVRHTTGLCRTAIYATEGFPKSVKLCGRSVGWPASEVFAWVKDTIATSRRESAGASNR
jgi:predicted DNA-binding transcriptional regulator AlpA